MSYGNPLGLGHGSPGIKGQHRSTHTNRKYARSARPVHYPLMPDGLSVKQAWWWFNNRYAQGRVSAT